MLEALRRTDPEVLADLAQGRLREKIPALGGVRGPLRPSTRCLIGAILAHLDFLDAQIERRSEAIETQQRPFQPAVKLLRSLDGIDADRAEHHRRVRHGHVGVPVRKSPRLSWAAQCPGNDQSAGKRRSGRHAKARNSSTTPSRTQR